MGSLAHMSVALWLAVAAVAAPLTPALEREAKALEAALIAPCCWSQQVSVHQSPVVDEMKADIRRLLAEGKTRQQILDSYVAEYGDRILAEPPARGFSRVFHVAPWLFLAASVGLVFVVLKRLRPAAVATPAASQAAAPPNDDESERIDEELRNLD